MLGHRPENVLPSLFRCSRAGFCSSDPAVEKLLRRLAAVCPFKFRKPLSVLVVAVVAVSGADEPSQGRCKVIVQPIEESAPVLRC